MALRRPNREWSSSMDTFPFLTVLICIIGTLMMVVLSLSMVGIASGAVEYSIPTVKGTNADGSGGPRDCIHVECVDRGLVIRWEAYDPALRPETDDLQALTRAYVTFLLCLGTDSERLADLIVGWIGGGSEDARKELSARLARSSASTYEFLLPYHEIDFKDHPLGAALVAESKALGFDGVKKRAADLLATAPPPSPFARLLHRVMERRDREFLYFYVRPSGVGTFIAGHSLIDGLEKPPTYGKYVVLTNGTISFEKRKSP